MSLRHTNRKTALLFCSVRIGQTKRTRNQFLDDNRYAQSVNFSQTRAKNHIDTSTMGKATAKVEAREKNLKVPEYQRVATFSKKGGPVTIERQKVRQNLGRGEALVHVLYSGVCHTDLHAVLGDWPMENKLPLIGGHEGAGVVIATGDGADEFVKIGDRVGIKWLADSCLQCEQCLRGFEPTCAKAQCSGFTVDGTFQQYAVASARHLTKIPDVLDLKSASSLLCAGLTVYRGK